MDKFNPNCLFTREAIVANSVCSAGGFGRRETWDNSADDYARLPIPDSSDPFIAFLEKHVDFNPLMRVLDIGCGSGVYGLALANRVGEVIGCDFSPAMISAARRKAAEAGFGNVRFKEGDFREIDLDGPFDLVFAHLTPAVADVRSFEKMMELSTSWCFIANPVRRTDHVLFETRKACGIEPDSDARDVGFLEKFALAWLAGATPTVEHYAETWHADRPLSVARDLYLNGMLAPSLSGEQRDIACRYLQSIAVDGIVHETTDTTIVMMGWQK